MSNVIAEAINLNFTFVAAGALMAYDTVIFLADEINIIWTQNWTLGKVLYILTRYWGILDSAVLLLYTFYPRINPESCNTFYNIATWSAKPGAIVCSMVLVLRTYAIWGRSMYVLVYLSLFLVMYIVILVYILIQSDESITFAPSAFPGLVPCVPTLGNNKLFVIFCVNMAFELNVLCLSLYKKFTHWRGGSTRVVYTLYRDGVIYFAVLFSISLANALLVVTMYSSHSPYYYLLIGSQDIVHTILTSRIIINVRKAAGVGEETYCVSPEEELYHDTVRSFSTRRARGFRDRFKESVSTQLGSL